MRAPIRAARTLTGALLLSAAAFVAACGNTADGVKQDAENIADKTAEAGAEAGAAVGGAAKTSDVKAALAADTTVDAVDINVDTDESAKTVTLNGTVRSEAHSARAEAIARENATGYTIVNKLTVRP